MKCKYKHTKYQPDDSEFVCPSCGSEEFYIDEGPGVEGAVECDALHDGDVLKCYHCGEDVDAKEWSDKIFKSKNLVKCPHCDGTGRVPVDLGDSTDKKRGLAFPIDVGCYRVKIR